MKLDPKSAASALALTAGIVSVICAILVAIAPDFLFSLANAWFHGIDLVKIQSANLTVGNFIFGLIGIMTAGWLAGYLFAVIYNSFVKRGN